MILNPNALNVRNTRMTRAVIRSSETSMNLRTVRVMPGCRPPPLAWDMALMLGYKPLATTYRDVSVDSELVILSPVRYR